MQRTAIPKPPWLLAVIALKDTFPWLITVIIIIAFYGFRYDEPWKWGVASVVTAVFFAALWWVTFYVLSQSQLYEHGLVAHGPASARPRTRGDYALTWGVHDPPDTSDACCGCCRHE